MERKEINCIRFNKQDMLGLKGRLIDEADGALNGSFDDGLVRPAVRVEAETMSRSPFISAQKDQRGRL